MGGNGNRDVEKMGMGISYKVLDWEVSHSHPLQVQDFIPIPIFPISPFPFPPTPIPTSIANNNYI